jgi:endonuclease/exonuclease/phosphatase family metal-dependent hydrolase
MQEKLRLKVASWNVDYANTQVEEAVAFVQQLFAVEKYDIVCLQEVSEMFLVRLKRDVHFSIHAGVDAMLDFGGTPQPIYHAILSTKEPSSTKEYSGVLIPDIHKGNIFSPLLKYKNIWINPALTRGFFSGDFVFGTEGHDQTVRIFSIHPPLSAPQDRADDLALVFKELSHEFPNIVCGDFNILETYPVKLLNWFLRGHFLQAMPWFNERKNMEERFASAGLKNPFAGMHLKTQREAGTQLDHILVPISATVTDQDAIQGTRAGFIGSDHYPVIASILL